jgi:hypothetical protein
MMSLPAYAERIFTSGFETNNFAATEWTGTTGSPTIQGTTVHAGSYSMRSNQGAGAALHHARRSLAAADTSGTYWVSFYVRIDDAPDTFPQSIWIWGNGNSSNNGSGPIHIKLVNGPKLRLTNTLTSTDTDGSTALSLNTWYEVSLKVVLGDSPNGSAELKLNGNVEASQTSTDTLDGANGFNKFFIGVGNSTDAASANYDLFFDDVRINDEQGSVFNDYATTGSRIALVKPGSNDTVTWTKTGANCSGTTNTDCVDDAPGTPDDSSGYNSSSTANDEERLNLTTLPGEVPNDADMILMHVFDRWDGNGTTGTRQGRMLVWDEGGVQTNGPTHSRCDVAAGNWSIPTLAQDITFDLGTRTKANVNGFDVGYEPLNSSECRVTAIWANVEWVEASAPARMPLRAIEWE